MLCWVTFAGSFYCGTVSQAPTVKMYLYFLRDIMKLQLAAHYLRYLFHLCSAFSH